MLGFSTRIVIEEFEHASAKRDSNTVLSGVPVLIARNSTLEIFREWI